MDVVGGFVLFGLLVYAIALVGGWLRMLALERRRRAHRRVQVRKADRWRFDLEEREALVAMRDVCDRVDREAKP